MEYPENVKKIASEILEVIKKYYPEIAQRNFDNYGYPERKGIPALERIEMCTYIELMKAGVFNKEL